MEDTMKKTTLALCALLSLLYLAPATLAADLPSRDVEHREARIRTREGFVSRLVLFFAKHFGSVESNIDGILPPRP
jgi:hypothetical protein